jgi:hypothetical protein
MQAPQLSRDLTRAIGIGLLPAAALALSGCEAVKGIFKAGVWVGVIAVVFVLAVAAFLVRALRS